MNKYAVVPFPQGVFRIINNQGGGGAPPTPPPSTKVTMVCTGGPSPRSRYATPPPPPLRALRAHLVTKGRLLAIHRVAPKAPENFVPFAGDLRECRVEVGLRRFLTQSISANPHGAPGPLTRDQRRIGQDGALYKCRLLPT